MPEYGCRWGGEEPECPYKLSVLGKLYVNMVVGDQKTKTITLWGFTLNNMCCTLLLKIYIYKLPILRSIQQISTNKMLQLFFSFPWMWIFWPRWTAFFFFFAGRWTVIYNNLFPIYIYMYIVIFTEVWTTN